MKEHSEFTLPELSRWHQKKFLNYATQVLTAQQQMMTKKGKNILHYTLQKKRRHEHLSHYPKGDRIDRTTGSQYFYHCHRENFETNEHGHFHCFMRYKYIPKRIKPVPLDDWDVFLDNPMTHLVAIGMNQLGQPIRLFTVNRWVTSEIFYEAKQSTYLNKKFKMTQADDPYWQVLDKWVEGMLQLFSPQIAWLHEQRDATLQNHSEKNQVYPYTDKTLEELSEIKINLQNQIEWVIG